MSSTENAGDTLKAFAASITTSKVKERIKILDNVNTCIQNSAIPEQAVKGIIKVLVSTLTRYYDRKSRISVEKILKKLLNEAKYKDELVSNYVGIIKPIVSSLVKVVPSIYTAGTALILFRWTFTILESLDIDNEYYNKLVELLSNLYYVIISYGKKTTILISANNQLKRLWKSQEVLSTFLGRLNELVVDDIHHLSLTSELIKYLLITKQMAIINKYKTNILDTFIKNVILSKVKQPLTLINSCVSLLSQVDRDYFKESLLPALDRGMLRNPEIVIPVIAVILYSIRIDLSSFSCDLSKQLLANCYVKDDQCSKNAVSALLSLSNQCSDSTSLAKIVRDTFDILNGKTGVKLTTVNQRNNLFNVISNCAENAQLSQFDLYENVIKCFAQYLSTETHEPTLVSCLKSLMKWTIKLSHKIPNDLIPLFQKGLTLKSSSPNVILAYLQCMRNTFKDDTMQHGIQMKQTFIVLISKLSLAQPVSTSQCVNIFYLLIRFCTIDLQLEEELTQMWEIIMDSKNAYFSNEKFLEYTSDQEKEELVDLCETLLLNQQNSFSSDSIKQYKYALIYCLLNAKSHETRSYLRKSVNRILSSQGGDILSLSLINVFSTFVAKQKSLDYKNETMDCNESIRPRQWHDSLVTLATVADLSIERANDIAMSVLPLMHNPCIFAYNTDAWVNLLSVLKVDAISLIEQRIGEFMNNIRLLNKDFTQEQSQMLSTIVRINPNLVVPLYMEFVKEKLYDVQDFTVNDEQTEVFRFDLNKRYQSIISQFAPDTTKKTGNIKKVGKNYSYSEQIMDIELQKEQDKKRSEKPIILSKKEQLLVEEKLAEDIVMRQELQNVYMKIVTSSKLIQYCIENSPDYLPSSIICYKIIQNLQKVMLFPLVVEEGKVNIVKETYSNITRFLLSKEINHLESSIVEVTEILLKRETTEISPTNAETTKLTDQVRFILEEVKKTVVTEEPKPMTAVGFSLLLYPLKCILKCGGAAIDRDSNIMITSLRLIEVHATLIRGDDPQNCASLLDREEMLNICIDVISLTTDSVQQTAESALIATSACAGGREGECIAKQAERNILLNAMKSHIVRLRDSSLQSLLEISETLTRESFTDSDWLKFNHRISIARLDDQEFISSLADILWNNVGLEEDLDVLPLVCNDDVIAQDNQSRQRCAARLIKHLIEHSQSLPDGRDQINDILELLLEIYEKLVYMPPIQLDSFGRPLEVQAIDKYSERMGIAFAFEAMANLFSEEHILPLFNFLVSYGLNDRNSQVNKEMLIASVAILNNHGKDNVSSLLPIFEKFLEEAPLSKSYDEVRQSVVILMGSLARHLDHSDTRILPIVKKLIEALSTPSQQVQQAVASCLPALIPLIKSESPALIEQLMDLLLTSDNYAKRRGAAYGIAGLVKGLGIMSLKNLGIIVRLTEAVQNKKSILQREGALFAFELLCSTLGRLFEPYVVNILPHLLICFGDGNNYIREAADATAKVVMSKLSAHGVKLVLPSLLSALEEDSWRTKTGSVELLGTMAYCAPKQLSSCLPAIVPKLAEVLADSHNKVREAGGQALKQIGAVIRNPEIQAISSVLLSALQEPTPKRTQACLQKLLATKFVHFIDAPSLALIMPVVVRAFDSRTTETRKMASQIIGNMYSLTDHKDLAPYLPQVIPGLKQSLLDPAPDVRSVSASALGAMVRGMGDSGFQQLVPWLMETLVSESSSVDRSGAAQGLSEVVGGMGMSKLETLMPGIIETASRSDISPCVRDGYMMMFIYLPGTFGDEFSKFIAKIIPCILKALADEAEFVRDTALRAGQRIVHLYAESAIQLLLPELENGLFHENWRIRYSSIQLVGDLLYRLSGVTGKMSTASTGDDDNFGSEMSQAAILKVLGRERMNRVLAGLYMGRSDTALTVRTAALHVWKTIVSHTPKTLRDILPTLFGLLLGSLASQSYDKRQVAARTLGDIVRKLGEKVLPEIIPILEKGLDSTESDQRQGVCIGLSEIMSSTSREHVQIYTDSLVATVIKALLDPLPEVRKVAATTFDNLHSNVGGRILDDILPKLLSKLNDTKQCEYALDGLKQVMTVKSRVVLPMLVPYLIAPPMNTRAVSLLTSVAGSALNPYLSTILSSLLYVVSENLNTPNEESEMKFAENVVLSVKTDEGIRILINELLNSMNNTDIRYAAVMLLSEFAKSMPAASGQLDEHLTTIYRTTFRLFTVDNDERLLIASSNCLATIVKKLDTSDLISQITPLRQALRLLDYKGNELPGLCVAKKGIQPMLPVFREGILNGSPEVKENASLGLSEMIGFTSPEALKPSVIHITGPSIRILGDKYAYTVKVALLDTMTLLLTKCAPSLKPFLPQLQTTFMKALNDPTRIVRIRSAAALCCLATIHQRVDPLVIELLNSATATENNDIRDTSLQALRGCIQSAGSRLLEKTIDDLYKTLSPLVESSTFSDITRRTVSACIGTLVPYLQESVRMNYYNSKLYVTDVNIDWMLRLGYSIVLTIAIKQSATIFNDDDKAMETLILNTSSDRVPIILSSLNGITYLLLHQIKNKLPVSDNLLSALCKTMKHESNDVKQAGAQNVAYIASLCADTISEKTVVSLIPMLVNGIREKRSTVKSWSETALVILLKLTEKTCDNLVFYNICINNLEAGMSDSLQDVYNKVLKKVALKADIDQIDDIDNTQLI